MSDRIDLRKLNPILIILLQYAYTEHTQRISNPTDDVQILYNQRNMAWY